MKLYRIFEFVKYSTAILLILSAFLISTIIEIYFTKKIEVINSYRSIWPIISVISAFFLYIYGVFEIGKKRLIEIIYSSFIAILFINLSILAMPAILNTVMFKLSTILLAMCMQFIFMFMWAFLANEFYYSLNNALDTIIISKDWSSINEYVEKISRNKLNYTIKKVMNISDKELWKEITKNQAVFLIDVPVDDREKIIEYCTYYSVEVYIIPQLYDITVKNSNFVQFDDVMAFRCRNVGLTVDQRFFKRLFDVVFSAVLLIISLPIMLVTALIIKAYDGGKIFYFQERITLNNQKFYVYKFRTMITDAEKANGPTLASTNDSRVTFIGKILRATRIDELPQLINVLKGDMSVVGPRPEREYFIDKYLRECPEFMHRVVVKAGLTGMAQVLGKYNTTPQDKLKFDLLYIQNYSFFLDIKLVFQTFKILFMKVSTEGVKNKEKVFRHLTGKIS